MQPWINFGKYLKATVIIYAQRDICVPQLFHHASPTCKKNLKVYSSSEFSGSTYYTTD